MFATDDSGTKVWEATYLPFGGVHTTTGTPINLRFPGQWFQSESGLHQNWMRDYDPTTGRYIQADPLGLVDGASVYGYALQNPGRYTDPRGELALPLVPAAVGIGVAILTYLLMQQHGDDFVKACGMLIEPLFTDRAKHPGRVAPPPVPLPPKVENKEIKDELGVDVGPPISDKGAAEENYPGLSGDPYGDFETITGKPVEPGTTAGGTGPNGEKVSIYPGSRSGGRTTILVQPGPGQSNVAGGGRSSGGIKIRY